MRDKDGFLIRCEFCDWQIIDDRDNKDYVCLKYPCFGKIKCYADEKCEDYKPVKK